MLTNYTPDNWFWKATNGRIYASARQIVTDETDTEYVAWLEAGNLPTPWPRDETGIETEAALAQVLAAHGLQIFAPTLDEVKDSLKAAIDEAAETERLRYITGGAGQAMTYQEKVAQAVAYTKAWLAWQADPDNVPEVKTNEYSLLAAGLGIDGDTLLEVAETVTYAYAIWQQIGSAIEATRLLAKVAIDNAADTEEARLIFDAVIWPTPQMLEAVS